MTAPTRATKKSTRAPTFGSRPLATWLRLAVGLIFATHGAQKLFGWFGGHGLDGTGQWMETIGLSPGYLMALLATSVALLVSGAGRGSVDEWLSQRGM